MKTYINRFQREALGLDAKWNEETKSGTYSDKVHHGEMKVKSQSIEEEVKDKLIIECQIALHSAWRQLNKIDEKTEQQKTTLSIINNVLDKLSTHPSPKEVTDSELEKEAEEIYPEKFEQYTNGIPHGMFGMCDSNYYERQAHIKAVQMHQLTPTKIQEMRTDIVGVLGIEGIDKTQEIMDVIKSYLK